MASVDVFIPCYNYGHFLKECVESVLDQDGVSVRALVIDDASTDDSAEVGRALAAFDRRVEFRQHSINQGHVATYNEGIDWASGEYALLLSADDMLTRGALKRATDLMDQHPEVGLSFGRGVTTDKPDYRCHPTPSEYRRHILSGMEFWEMSCREGSNIVSTPTAVVRTSLQKRIGGYRKELPHTADLEMWLRFAAHAAVGVIDADQGFYRIHGRNMHIEQFPEMIKVLEQHRDAFEILFREYGHLLKCGDRLRQMALRGLALGVIRSAGRRFECGDVESSSRLANVALTLYPQVRTEREWERLCWKQRIGPNGTWLASRLLRLFRRQVSLDRSPFGQCRVFGTN